MSNAQLQLVGMLDSPYVRRVAVSLHALGLRLQAAAADHPALVALSRAAEALPEFIAAPYPLP